MYRRILCPIDGSETARRGLNEAIGLAKQQHARLRILNIIEEVPAMESWGLDIRASGYAADMLQIMESNGKKVVQLGLDLALSSDVKAEGASINSFARRSAECIVEDALSWKADLIVMGTHGHRGVSRLILGSDAEIVIRTSPVPVLLVRTAESGTTDI
jgi:nucleotide-binding universal stress UspA family protein